MSKLIIYGLVAALLMTTGFTGPLVWSDGGYFSKGELVAVSTDQRAILIQNGDEISMTFSTAYSGEGDDFAWVIPTPVPPRITDVSETGELGESAFDFLQEYTAPISIRAGGGGWGGPSDAVSVSPITIYGKVTLEHYEVSILGAAATSPLMAWLQSNGYAVDPAAARVLDAYIRDNWVFVAVKLIPGEKRHYENEFLPPLTIRYRHDRLVFPLRISSVSTTQPAAITLYVIAESTVSSSNVPTKNLVLSQSPGLDIWLSTEQYIEDSILETSGNDGPGLVVLWKGEYEPTNELRRILDQLMKIPFPSNGRIYLTRLEARIGPAAMTEDIQLVAEPSPQSFQVKIYHTGRVLLKPLRVTSLSDVVAIASGEANAIVLKKDGTVWTFGGPWGPLSSATLERVDGLTDIVSIDAGGLWVQLHAVALKKDGTVLAWGFNNDGQLGDGTTTDRWTPAQVRGLSGVVAIAAGELHSVALRADGTVWTWGYNIEGQLGDGTTTDRWTPVQVRGLSGVVAIAAGYSQTVALRADGTMWTWGGNGYGQLGDGTTTDRRTPLQVPGLSGVLAIGASAGHTAAVKEDGTLWLWGGYSNLAPMPVTGLSRVTAVAVNSGYTGFYHVMALKEDGTVWGWGMNTYGAIGDGTTTRRRTPVRVSDLSGVVAIATGSSRTMALKEDGTVWLWGAWP